MSDETSSQHEAYLTPKRFDAQALVEKLWPTATPEQRAARQAESDARMKAWADEVVERAKQEREARNR